MMTAVENVTLRNCGQSLFCVPARARILYFYHAQFYSMYTVILDQDQMNHYTRLYTLPLVKYWSLQTRHSIILVQCTVQSTLYIIQCTVTFLQCTVNFLQCIVQCVQCKVQSVECEVQILHFITYTHSHINQPLIQHLLVERPGLKLMPLQYEMF